MNILTIAILNIIIIGSYGVTLNKSDKEIITKSKDSPKSASINSKFEYINDNQNKIVIELDDSSLINSYEVVRPQKGDTLLEATEKMKKHRNMVMNLNYENNLRILNNNKKYLNGYDIEISKTMPYLFVNISDEKDSEKIIKNFTNLLNYGKGIKNITAYNNKEPFDSAVETEDIEPKLALPDIFGLINVDDAIEEGTYRGQNINIGIYEASYKFDVSNDEFKNDYRIITVKDSYLSHNHANTVASIAIGNSGIANKSNVYSVGCMSLTECEDDIEWFVRNSVNVINASIGADDDSLNGIYGKCSKDIDRYIKDYFFTFVGAAGNDTSSNPTYRVNPMGIGYNIISVGNSGSTSDDRHNTSCYVERTSYNGSKPNIMAPGSVDTLFDDDTGTSYAAPQVTGCIALLMEEFPYLIGYPELITSIVTSSASPMSSTYNNDDSIENKYDASGLHNQIGSGLLNYEKMREAAETCLDIFVPSNSSPEEVVDYIEFDANANQRIRASLSWLANGTDTNNFTNYDLYLHKKNGSTYKLMKYIDGTTNNVEFLDFDVQLSGTYRLSVKQNEINVTGDYLGLSYVLIDDSIGGSTSGGKYGHVYEYTSISNTKHRGTCLCGCGDIIEESHTFRITGVGTPSKCIYCGKTSGGIPGIFPLNNNKEYVTENGSYKLYNGVTYLVEKDIEAYLNGSLVFIPINCYVI